MTETIRGIGYWRQRLELAALAVAGLDALAYIVASALADWSFGEYIWMLIFFVIVPLLGLAVTRWNAKVGAGLLALILIYAVVASVSYVLAPTETTYCQGCSCWPVPWPPSQGFSRPSKWSPPGA